MAGSTVARAHFGPTGTPGPVAACLCSSSDHRARTNTPAAMAQTEWESPLIWPSLPECVGAPCGAPCRAASSVDAATGTRCLSAECRYAHSHQLQPVVSPQVRQT